MPFRHLSTVAVASLLAALTGCVVAPPRDRVVYGQPSYGQPSYGQPAYGQPVPRQVPVYAEYGRVENIGFVQSAQRPSGAGAVLGAVIGGVIGNQFGRGMGRAAATGAGAVGGALIGNSVENRNARDGELYRVQVRFDNGTVREFDFQRIDDLRSGDRVKLEGGQLHRV